MKLALLVLTFLTFNHYSKRLIEGDITGHHFMEKAPVLINLLVFMIASKWLQVCLVMFLIVFSATIASICRSKKPSHHSDTLVLIYWSIFFGLSYNTLIFFSSKKYDKYLLWHQHFWIVPSQLLCINTTFISEN